MTSVESALADAAPRCFWLDRPERPAAQPALEEDCDVDLAIVGSGYTGLWAALQALEAEPGRSMLLLEASRIGEGASGRNGGFADTSLSHGIMNGLHHFPDEIDALNGLSHRNFAEFVASLERHGIDGGYEATGKLEVATTPNCVESLREAQAAHARFGEPTTWLDRDALAAEIRSPTYHAGLYVPGGGLVDPARLCWGLAQQPKAHNRRRQTIVHLHCAMSGRRRLA